MYFMNRLHLRKTICNNCLNSNMTPYPGKGDNLATNFLEGDPHSQKSDEIMQYINTVTVNV